MTSQFHGTALGNRDTFYFYFLYNKQKLGNISKSLSTVSLDQGINGFYSSKVPGKLSMETFINVCLGHYKLFLYFFQKKNRIKRMKNPSPE